MRAIATTRYGGHSSCVSLEADGQPPIVFDLGTGLRPYGESIDGPFHGTSLLSHLHWDHVQGLPFFAPLHRAETTLDVYGPRQPDAPLDEVFAQLMRPPFFPIRPRDLTGDLRFHDTGDDDFPIGSAKVRARWVRHVGPTLGYRVDWNGVSVAYIPDHGPGCCPDDADDYIPQEILELCDGVDVLIHDAQHTPRRVRSQALLGSLHDGLRGARRARVGRAADRAVPPRSRRTSTPTSIGSCSPRPISPRTSAPASSSRRARG